MRDEVSRRAVCLCVLCVQSHRHSRSKQNAEVAETQSTQRSFIPHPSSLIPHSYFIGYTPREKENETTCIPEAKK